MTQATHSISYDTLIEAARSANLDEDAIHPKYSGRAMYGATCFGLVHLGPAELLRFIIALAFLDDEAADALLDDARGDTLGRSQITYWPGVEVTNMPD